MGKSIKTQRSIPASTLQIVDSVSRAILTSLNDPELSGEARRVLLALTLTLAQWLWPEPAKASTPLPPNTRPRLVQERAQLLLDGQLDTPNHDASPWRKRRLHLTHLRALQLP